MVSDNLVQLVNAQLARLNPCSNGIWSLTVIKACMTTYVDSLNPCSNGIWSLTKDGSPRTRTVKLS